MLESPTYWSAWPCGHWLPQVKTTWGLILTSLISQTRQLLAASPTEVAEPLLLPPHTNVQPYLPGAANVHAHLIYYFLGPLHPKRHIALSVQPFLHGWWHILRRRWIATPFSLKFAPCRGDLYTNLIHGSFAPTDPSSLPTDKPTNQHDDRTRPVRTAALYAIMCMCDAA